MKEAVEYLAARPEPLTSTLTAAKGSATQQEEPVRTKRKVVLGTVPAYDYTGQGVKLDGVTAGSPADKVELQIGDIIVRIGETVIEDLETFSDALKRLQAGAEIAIVYMRDGTEYTVNTEVVER